MNSESRTRLSLVPIIKQTRPLEADAVTEVETEEKVKEWNINMTQYITTILSALLDTAQWIFNSMISSGVVIGRKRPYTPQT